MAREDEEPGPTVDENGDVQGSDEKEAKLTVPIKKAQWKMRLNFMMLSIPFDWVRKKDQYLINL